MNPVLMERIGDLDGAIMWTSTGSVTHVRPSDIAVGGLRLSIGDGLLIHSDTKHRAKVITLDDTGARALLFGDTRGIGRGDRVTVEPGGMSMNISDELIGRAIDGSGTAHRWPPCARRRAGASSRTHAFAARKSPHRHPDPHRGPSHRHVLHSWTGPANRYLRR